MNKEETIEYLLFKGFLLINEEEELYQYKNGITALVDKYESGVVEVGFQMYYKHHHYPMCVYPLDSRHAEFTDHMVYLPSDHKFFETFVNSITNPYEEAEDLVNKNNSAFEGVVKALLKARSNMLYLGEATISDGYQFEFRGHRLLFEINEIPANVHPALVDQDGIVEIVAYYDYTTGNWVAQTDSTIIRENTVLESYYLYTFTQKVVNEWLTKIEKEFEEQHKLIDEWCKKNEENEG